MNIQKRIRVLLIEDEEFDVIRVKRTLKPFDTIEIIDFLSDGVAALELLRTSPRCCDVVIMDFQIAGGLMGENLIRKIKEIDQSLQIIVITKMTVNVTDFEFANGLLKAGAFWYCTKYPVDMEHFIYQPTDFVMSVFNAYEKGELERARLRSEKKIDKNISDILTQKKIIGVSQATQTLLGHIDKYAARDVNILITGDSGTGKELIANNIHYQGSRKLENFVPINCGSIPADLVESELFGYVKGAFTGANAEKAGLFELANNGTVFLDEVAELPPAAQVKLLRVIQEGEVEKIGRQKKITIDVRIIAATNKDLRKEVAEKRFREDLYYRLSVVPIHVLPLKERRDDVPELINYYLTEYSKDMNRPRPVISDDALAMLCAYDWPGNVRELKNVVQRLLFNDERTFSVVNVLNALGVVDIQSSPDQSQLAELFQENSLLSLKQAEKIFREKYLLFIRTHSHTDADAAQKLGVAPSNYSRMIKELGLK
jgi:two-component system, NtrC family, response regulator AtoC